VLQATSPALVNLQALLSRFRSICRSRMGSTVNAPRFSWASTTRRFLFCSASCPAVLMTSLVSGASCTVFGFRGAIPQQIGRHVEVIRDAFGANPSHSDFNPGYPSEPDPRRLAPKLKFVRTCVNRTPQEERHVLETDHS